MPDSDPPFISEKEVATKENIAPDEEYHLLKTLETGTTPSLQVVPDNVKKYLFRYILISSIDDMGRKKNQY